MYLLRRLETTKEISTGINLRNEIYFKEYAVPSGRDRFDEYSEHFLLKTVCGRDVGYVRAVKPIIDLPLKDLPVQEEILDKDFTTPLLWEISKICVKPQYRRDMKALSTLAFAAAKIIIDSGAYGGCCVMTTSLARGLTMLGFTNYRLGLPFEYHGSRAVYCFESSVIKGKPQYINFLKEIR